MKKDDLQEMAKRCRLMAGTADAFTKRRLLDLASRYEARLTSWPPPAKQPIALSMANVKIDPARHNCGPQTSLDLSRPLNSQPPTI